MKSLIKSLHPAFSSWRMKLASLALVGTVALFCLAAASGPHSERGDGASHMPAVEGSWLLTISQPGEIPFPSIATFGAGGALVVTDGGLSPAWGNVYQGIWARSGPHEITFTFWGFKYDDAGALANYIRVHETIKLDRSGQTYNSLVSTVELLDLDKNVLVSVPTTTHGERITAH